MHMARHNSKASKEVVTQLTENKINKLGLDEDCIVLDVDDTLALDKTDNMVIIQTPLL